MKLNLTRTLGALSLGALALVGCQSSGAAKDEEAAAATAEPTCSGREGDKDEGEQDGAGGH